MNASISVEPKDSIRIFRPGISDAEYALRTKLQTMRNCASAMITKTDSDTALALAWMCSEYVTDYIYASVNNDTLEDVAHFCHRLMVTAMQAEAIDDGAMS